MQDVLIRRIVRPLYEVQRRVRPSTRAAILARDAGIRFRRDSQDWSQRRKEDWILRRLRVVVREAAAAPFYREWFAGVGFDPSADFDFDDFARLPVLDRETVRSEMERMRVPEVARDQVRKDATGGSTGVPTKVYKGPQERGWRESGGEYFMSRIGCPPGSRTAMLWGHHLDPVGSDHWSDRLRTWISNQRWFDCLRVSEDRFRDYHREMQAWRPRCVIAYASALAPLADVAASEGEAVAYPTGCFVTGAEKLRPDDRERVQEVFGRTIHERYGGRDVGLIGFQTRAPQDLAFEIDWPNVLVEPLTEESTSSILITKLHGDAMPLIRYRIGDMGRFSASARPGHPSLRLEEVFGREVDRLWLPDGRWVQALAIPHMMKDFPVREFRLVQAEDFAVSVEVVAEPEFTNQHRDEILATIAANLPGLSINLEQRREIPRTPSGKLRPVISHVNFAGNRTHE